MACDCAHDDRLLTIKELSELTQLAIGTLYRLSSEGRIPTVHLSARCIRFRLSDLRHWIESKVVYPEDSDSFRLG